MAGTTEEKKDIKRRVRLRYITTKNINKEKQIESQGTKNNERFIETEKARYGDLLLYSEWNQVI